jgi:WD40 repeat protein
MSKKEYYNPFPGLRSFEEDEEYLFFGREKQIDALIQKLSKTRFLAVIGASGSGKSSLVKSGLLPSLHSGYLAEAGSCWRICTFRPGSDPIGNLSIALCNEEILGIENKNDTSPEAIESILRRNEKGIGNVIQQLSLENKQNILIVVDQFEELFRFSKYEKAENKGTRDSVSFINLLIAASKFSEVSIYVVFTMRSDFISDCTEFRGLPEAINEGQYLIPRMTREERKSAITGPIAVGGAEISQALLTRLLNDVGDNPDQLPILQHALMRTWEYWQKNSKPQEPIDLLHYQSIGTMSKALSLHAEEAYFEIADEKGREICKKLFRSLTEKSDDGRGTRRPTIVKEICEYAEIDIEEIKKVIDVFRIEGRSFLMPPIGIELKEETVIDISHESLMRVWERLISWVNEEVESAELYTRLALSAALYQEGKTGIWRDPELQMAMNWKVNQNPNQSWAKRYDPSFERAINFLEYSQEEKNRELRGEEKKRKSALVRLRIFMSVITLAFCLSVYFGINSFRNEKRASNFAKEALLEKLVSDSLKVVAEYESKKAAEESEKSKAAAIAADQAALKSKNAEKMALIAREEAVASSEVAISSLEIAKKATKSAKDSALYAKIQRKKADSSSVLARAEKENTLKAKGEVDRLRMLAESKNIALKSSQLINEAGKDTLSLQLAFLAYGINNNLNGPSQNRIIYEALKNQLTRYYTKIINVRKDLKFEFGAYGIRSASFLNTNNFITVGDESVFKNYELIKGPIELKLISSSQKYSEAFSSLCLSLDNNWAFAGSINGSLLAWNTSGKSSEIKLIHKGIGKNIFLQEINNNENNYTLLSILDNSAFILKSDKNTLKLLSETPIVAMQNKSISAASAIVMNDEIHLFFAEEKTMYEQVIKSDGSFLELKKVITFPENISSIALSLQGKFVSLGGTSGGIIVYRKDSDEYNLYRQIRGHLSSISVLKFSLNDSLLISGSLDHSIRSTQIFKLKNEESLVFKEKEVWIRSVAICPDNKYIISVGQSGLVQTWPLDNEIILKELQAIQQYNSFLNLDVNEIRLKEELGDVLYKSIWESDFKSKNFKEYWDDLKKKYLNE